MTTNRFLRIIIPILLTTLVGASCTINEPIGNNNPSKDSTLIWIEQSMRQYYLWEDEIPKATSLDYTLAPEPFFQSLLSDKDGKSNSSGHYYYSSINPTKAKTKSYMGDSDSFGFEFQYYNIRNGDKPLYYALLVLYVLPDSPAGEQGLKRGDWILQINGQPVPDNASGLINILEGNTTLRFGINNELPGIIEVTKEINLAARPVIDDPVYVDTTYHFGGKKISYMLYNHFTSGTDADSELFNNSMRRAFSRFKSENPSDLILDLRYNPGGLVSAARLLSVMIAPESSLGSIFCRFSYNNKMTRFSDSLLLDPRTMQSGANLNLQQLYIITGPRTASSSELVINGLSPYMNITIIGSKTEGKNVASSAITDDKYEWELHPIISLLSNRDHFADYSSGFTPDHPCIETQQEGYHALGDTAEFILNQTLNFIAHGHPIQSKGISLRSDAIEAIGGYSSVERRAGMILNGELRIDRP